MGKPGAGPAQASTSSVIQTLLKELTAGELERVAACVIRDHRSRLQKAQDLFEQLEATGTKDADPDRLEHDYRIAMLNLHVQHQLVSLVVDRLGYLPKVDGQQVTLN